MKGKQLPPRLQNRALRAAARRPSHGGARRFVCRAAWTSPSRLHDPERSAARATSKTIILPKLRQALVASSEIGSRLRRAPCAGVPSRLSTHNYVAEAMRKLGRHLPDISRTRPQEAPAPLLLAGMCRPAGGARRREDRREGLPRDLQRVQQDRGEELDIGVERMIR